MSSFEGLSCEIDLFAQRHEPFYAQLFQDMVISDAFLRSNQLLRNIQPDQVVLSERSLFSNAHIFVRQIREKGLITELEALLLLRKSKNFFDFLISSYNLKPLFIFLYDSIHPTWLRLRERARDGEQNLQHNDLAELDYRYNELFKSPLFPYRCIFVNLRQYAVGIEGIPNKSALSDFIDLQSVVDFLDKEIYGN